MLKINPVSDKRQAQIEHEAELMPALIARARGRCEHCHGLPDWRGLSRHHLRHKGMGGSSHVYTLAELELWCGPCHDAEHGVRDAPLTLCTVAGGGEMLMFYLNSLGLYRGTH